MFGEIFNAWLVSDFGLTLRLKIKYKEAKLLLNPRCSGPFMISRGGFGVGLEVITLFSIF